MNGRAGAHRTPRALTIAGSDSGGGAGIQADLKAFARCGVHGTSAITAVTAQSTTGVSAIYQLPPEMVLAQAREVIADIGVDAVKIGMLGTTATVLAVAGLLDELQDGTPVVLDPVMVAESGARLLEPDAERALRDELLPRVTVATPNVPEARVLAGAEPGVEGASEDEETRALLRAVLALGPRAVVLTGGHRTRAVDMLAEQGVEEIVEIEGERHPDGAAHGSGCTHSAALAAALALGATPLEAATRAREVAGQAIARGLRDVGSGAGPVDVIGLKEMRTR